MSHQALRRERQNKIKERDTLVQLIGKLRLNLLTAGSIDAAKIEVAIANYDQEVRALDARLDEIDAILPPSEREKTTPDDTGSDIESPPEPERPPDTIGFVGRAADLAYFGGVLARAHFAVITGMAGVGKSMLAARLAQQIAADPARLFWHRFYEDEGGDVIVWKLAAFLAHNGQPDTWKRLNQPRGSVDLSRPLEIMLDYLVPDIQSQGSQRQGYVICLDDFQYVDDARHLAHKLRARLEAVAAAGEATLIITSQRMPDFVTTVGLRLLSGLNREDAAALLAARGVHLTEEQFGSVYYQTEGNALLLNLAIAALQDNKSPERLVAQLAATEQNIEKYLKAVAYTRLKKTEKAVMRAVAVLQSGTRAAIDALLGIKDTQDTLDKLCALYLVNEEKIAKDKVGYSLYSQHAMVQSFYYELLGQSERQQMHTRAAAYYEREEIDALRIIRHYQSAGEYERSAQLATSGSIVVASINGGRLGELRHLLQQYQEDQLQPQTWALILLALARVAQWYGENAIAQTYCQRALATLHAMPKTSDVRIWESGAYRLMAQLIRRQDPEEAKSCLQRSLDLLPDKERHERAATHIILSTILIEQGDLEAAEPAVRAGLNLLPSEASYERIEALQNLGVIFSNQDKLAEGIRANEEALAMCQKLGDRSRMSEIYANLGMDRFARGDRQDGAADLQQALDLAQEVGSKRQQAGIHVNLIWMYFEMRDEAAALDHMEQGLNLARRGGFSEFIVTGLINGTYLYLHKGDLAAATKALDEAEPIATVSSRQQLPEIQSLRDQAKQMHDQAIAAGQET